MEKKGDIAIGIKRKEGLIVTAFIPPLKNRDLFKAMSSALLYVETLRDKSKHIKGIVYEQGDPEKLEANLRQLSEQVGESTGYEVQEGIVQLGETAMAGAAQANRS